jgi:iron complex outermembrane receptor protein
LPNIRAGATVNALFDQNQLRCHQGLDTRSDPFDPMCNCEGGVAVKKYPWLVLVVAMTGGPIPGLTQSVETQSAGQLAEVVVTAERREADLQRTALAITAIDGAAIETAVSRPEELTSLVPSLYVAPSGGMTQIYIRGVGNLGGTSFAEGAVAFNVDQITIGRPTALDAVYFDLERVEVLKGPQGTLYGRNATGGAINVVSNKPRLGEFGVNAIVEAGSFNLFKGSAALNLPLTDTIAARVAVQRIEHGGYLTDGYNDQDTLAARGHLLVQPGGNFSMLLSLDYAHQGGQADGYVPSFRTCGDWCGPSEPSNRALEKVGGFAGIVLAPSDDGVGFQDNTFWSATASLEWALGPTSLAVIPAHRSAKIDTLIYPSLFRGRVLDQSRQDSLEVRLASSGDGVAKWVVGAFYYNEDIKGDYGYSHGLALQAQRVQPNITNKSAALFGQLTYSVTGTVRLTGGLRYTRDEKNLSGLQRCFSGILCGAPLGSGLPGTSIQMLEDGSWTNTSYKAGIEWDLASQSMLYANVSTGFKSGGFYPAALNAEFKPEKLTAFAVGWKNRLADNRVQLNAEAFWWDYKDHQESHVGTACIAASGSSCTAFGNVFLTENVGESRIKGIDIDAAFVLTRNDRIDLGFGYLDAVATTFVYNVPVSSPPSPLIACIRTTVAPFINVNCSGIDMPRAPQWSGRLAYEHSFRRSSGAAYVLSMSTYRSADYWASIDFVPGTRQAAYGRSDASFTYRAPDDRWSLGAWINNIEDEAVAGVAGVKIFAGTPGVQLRAPRTYGLRLTANF